MAKSCAAVAGTNGSRPGAGSCGGSKELGSMEIKWKEKEKEGGMEKKERKKKGRKKKELKLELEGQVKEWRKVIERL